MVEFFDIVLGFLKLLSEFDDDDDHDTYIRGAGTLPHIIKGIKANNIQNNKNKKREKNKGGNLFT